MEIVALKPCTLRIVEGRCLLAEPARPTARVLVLLSPPLFLSLLLFGVAGAFTLLFTSPWCPNASELGS